MVGYRLAVCFAFIILLGVQSMPAQAQSAESFYKDKTLKLLVASGSGGGYDTYTRVLGRHIGRHVPGQPNIVVQNMPGASGLKATNYIANSAPKDGSEILATYNAILIEPLVGGNAVQFDILKLTMIGSISKVQNLCVVWNTSSIQRIEDAMEREVVLAATGATGNAATLPRLLNLIVGTKFKVVMGYSTSESRLAVERGEAEGICGYSYGTLVASSPDWILNHKVRILIQNGRKPHPKIPDVPLTYDKIKTEQGKAMFRLYTASEEVGRPYVAPPGVPADRTEALRRAFDATLRDPEFLVDAEKTNLEVDPLTGEEMLALLRDVYATDPKVVEQVRELVNRSD
jgi:tripartite-type tricarboxylate transporter receptor subunit TctC